MEMSVSLLYIYIEGSTRKWHKWYYYEYPSIY